MSQNHHEHACDIYHTLRPMQGERMGRARHRARSHGPIAHEARPLSAAAAHLPAANSASPGGGCSGYGPLARPAITVKPITMPKSAIEVKRDGPHPDRRGAVQTA